jgi:two-component system, NarL family, response regulator NreC
MTAHTPPLRLVLVDDHAVVRAGLRRVLEGETGWEVVAEAGALDRALRAVLGHKPDVLVLDLNLDGVSALEAIPDFLARSPATRIVVLTMQCEPAYARDAMRAGASAYALKEAAESELVTAVARAAAGETYLNPHVGALLAAFVEVPPDEDGLSDREHEVLRLLALGHTNAEIADQLFLSRRTVESHRANLQRKLGLSTRAELTRHVLDHGLLEV